MSDRATEHESAGRVPRADARRNRERILIAASELFANKGVNTSTAEIAGAAGVGIGTVFRHFPTKEALLKAVLIQRLEHIAADAESRAQGEDAGAGFLEFFREVVADSGTKVAVAEALGESGVDVIRAASPVAERLRSAINELLTQAQQAGVIRDDVDVDDILTLLAGVTQAAHFAGGYQKTLDRTLAVVIAGLRAPASS
jgi:AcrR family transcriptional regulator